MPLKWVANSADRKPDFDIDDAQPGQVVTIQIGRKRTFTGPWLYAYSVEISTANTIDYPALSLAKGTWYARHRVNGGRWGNIVTMTIA
jgi:hypothetical protein